MVKEIEKNTQRINFYLKKKIPTWLQAPNGFRLQRAIPHSEEFKSCGKYWQPRKNVRKDSQSDVCCVRRKSVSAKREETHEICVFKSIGINVGNNRKNINY